MISRAELENAIREYENAPNNYSNCEKLATFYALYDHMYGAEPVVGEETVQYEGKSEFADTIKGTDPQTSWAVMDELMDALSVLQPKLYQGTLDKIRTIE